MLWKLPDIKLSPDTIFYIFGFPVTNTLLCTWVSIAVLLLLFYAGSRRRERIPSGMQNFVEWAVESLRGIVEGVVGKEKGRKFLPFIGTIFLFIIVSNLLDIIPGVDTIGQINGPAIQQLHTSSQPVLGFLLFGDISNQITPWIRPATTDLNLTLAMALIVVVTSQVLGFATLGFSQHVGKYINIKALRKFSFEGFIEFFVGLLEIISEVARILSLAFRLFGNIFAGSVVLAVFAFLLPFVSDIIFIPFEIFVAFVQALVFSLLSITYMQLAMTSHEHAEEEFEENEAHAGHPVQQKVAH